MYQTYKTWATASQKTPTLLVTGGAGYIGSHTVQALKEAGYQVVILDTRNLGIQDYRHKL